MSARDQLLQGLNPEQCEAVRSKARLLGVVAGAGSGKTEVMARRVAWWVGPEDVDRSKIIAFTFTEAAAEELKFRVRAKLETVTSDGEEATLSGMYVGTIHAFCLKCLREFAPHEYYNFDVLDDAGRIALVQRGMWGILAFGPFMEAAKGIRVFGQYRAVDLFLRSYDILNEHLALEFDGPATLPPRIEGEQDWCKTFTCETALGTDELSTAFATSAARYYAYLRARRFLDFSTAQAEFVRKLRTDGAFRTRFLDTYSHMVVDEVQDINPAQLAIIETMIDAGGHVTAVGDHRQAIYSFRGGQVELMGDLFARIDAASDGHVQPLPANYRSTPRIVGLANDWSKTIGHVPGLDSPDMTVGVAGRTDFNPKHVALTSFATHEDEAQWIAETISTLIPGGNPEVGAAHGENPNVRGLGLSDVAILVRSSKDVSTYRDVLRESGIPSVVRGGADLFSQPEVLAVLSALSLVAGMTEYYGGTFDSALPARVQEVLGTNPEHTNVIPAAFALLRTRGVAVPSGAEQRVIRLCGLLRRRISEDGRLVDRGIDEVANSDARKWLRSSRKPRRLFPQTLLLWLLEEAGFGDWGDIDSREFESVRFHVGQISGLIQKMESSGWIGPDDRLKYLLSAVLQWGSGAARAPEAPLLVPPNAVTITTIHSAKGLQFAAVFLADVRSRRFPSQRARTAPKFAFDETEINGLDPTRLADNANYDDERRLMYVALTRAERFLFVTKSGEQESLFFRELPNIFRANGAYVGDPPNLTGTCDLAESALDRNVRLSTSFSDLRYFLECPQDFFTRKVLGFAPPIGQEFGYGRGVHNLLRAVHEQPAEWAALAADDAALRSRVEELVESGLFYLRHTVGEPYENLKNKAVAGVIEYVRNYRDELQRLEFEPEKPFETLIPEEDVLITGAIDVVRLDDPPTVTLIDFKSGNSSGDNASGLSADMMAMQLGVYGIAAKKELEFEPEVGLVRYIGESDPNRRELKVDMSDGRRAEVRANIAGTARRIKARDFRQGPAPHLKGRCGRCDFGRICPSQEARAHRAGGEPIHKK
jgi:DNA helicase-2/ATP-dependent DNA helicase PcrA